MRREYAVERWRRTFHRFLFRRDLGRLFEGVHAKSGGPNFVGCSGASQISLSSMKQVA